MSRLVWLIVHCAACGIGLVCMDGTQEAELKRHAKHCQGAKRDKEVGT